MLYRTILLEMIQDRPDLYEQLRSSKRLLPTIDAYATDLKATHEAWKGLLSRQNPTCDPTQIASQALELAVLGIADRLPSGSMPTGTTAEPLSLDAAMNFLRSHTPPA